MNKSLKNIQRCKHASLRCSNFHGEKYLCVAASGDGGLDGCSSSAGELGIVRLDGWFSSASDIGCSSESCNVMGFDGDSGRGTRPDGRSGRGSLLMTAKSNPGRALHAFALEKNRDSNSITLEIDLCWRRTRSPIPSKSRHCTEDSENWSWPRCCVRASIQITTLHRKFR